MGCGHSCKRNFNKRNAAFEKAESATGVEKAKALDEAISIVDAKVAVAFYEILSTKSLNSMRMD